MPIIYCAVDMFAIGQIGEETDGQCTFGFDIAAECTGKLHLLNRFDFYAQLFGKQCDTRIDRALGQLYLANILLGQINPFRQGENVVVSQYPAPFIDQPQLKAYGNRIHQPGTTDAFCCTAANY